jgi:hypothetical protein
MAQRREQQVLEQQVLEQQEPQQQGLVLRQADCCSD